MTDQDLILKPELAPEMGTPFPYAADARMVNYPIREALSAAFRYRYRLLLGLIAPPALAIALVFITPPTYRAQVTLFVKSGREYLSEGTVNRSQEGPTVTKLEEINSEIELLQDRAVIEDTINRIGLENLYPGIDAPGALGFLPGRGSAMDRAVKSFSASLGVSMVKMSNVLNVTFDSDDREKATQILDTYLATYLRRHAAVFTSGRSGSFLTSIDQDTSELQRLQQEQARIKLDGGIYDIVPQRGALISQRVESETHLQETIDRKDTLEQRIAYLSGIRGSIPATLTTTETAPNEEIVQVNQTLTSLRQSESALLSRYPPDNPDVRRIRDQIVAAQRRIRELQTSSVRTSVAPSQLPQEIEQELVMDRAELVPLDGEVTRYRSLILTYSNELRRLENADTALRMNQLRIDTVADNLKSIRAEYDIARTGEEMDRERVASVVPVAPAVTPLKPAKPSPLLLVAGGLLLGLLTSGSLAVWAMVTNSVFYTREGLEALTGLPVLATVPFLIQSRKKDGRPV